VNLCTVAFPKLLIAWTIVVYFIDWGPKKISCEWLRNIYYSLVYPHLLYGIEMYANTCVTYLDKLIKLNNKILRILQNCPIRTHVLDLYTKFNVLPLDKLHNHQIILLYLNVWIMLTYFHLCMLTTSFWMLRFMIAILELVLIYMFLVLEVLLDKGVLDIKEVCYGIDYLLD